MKRSTRFKSRQFHYNPVFSVVALLVGVVGTIAVTQVLAQSANEMIYGCVNKTNGAVRIVATGETCKNHENALNWSVQGPAGPAGAPGSSSNSGLPFHCAFPCYLTPFADKFRGKDFSGAQLSQASFAGADLTGVTFKGGLFISTVFSDANLTGADLSDFKEIPGWDRSRNNKFIRANLTNANFSNGSFTGSDFSDTNLQNTDFSNTILRSNTFKGAQKMNTANITDTTWIGVTCPDGTNSDNNGSTCVGHF